MKAGAISSMLFCCAIPSYSSILSTVPAQISNVSAWGPVASGFTPTYGQTFTADVSNNILNSIAFEIQNTEAPISFQAYVYAWNGSAITGPALFTSAVQTVPKATGFQLISVNTGAVSLTPGNVYAAFFSTIGDGGTSVGAAWGLAPQAAYTGGKFIYNNATTFTGLFAPPSPAWNQFGEFGNAAFQLVFSSTACQLNFSAVTSTSNVLWPPNHEMVAVTVIPTVSDDNNCGVACKITAVSSNEPVDADGDWVITGNLTLNLRADRLGNGSGRIYTVNVECTDKSGNLATKTVMVTVPHDNGS